MRSTQLGEDKLKTERSSDLYKQALKYLPGGVNSPVRAMRSIGRTPIFISEAAGPEIVDVDGNRYIDYVSSWAPLIAGHAHPEVVAAVTAAAHKGTSYGAPTEGEVELARQIVERVPSAEMVRMTSSGTEASMSALRLARAVTGRDLILKFAGAYHGHVDGLLAQAGSGLATASVPASPGVTEAQAKDTVIVGWNDRQQLEAAVEKCGERLAAIIAEPVPANMGLVPAEEGFLELLREQANSVGALLIFDEVISGFRVASGGAQDLYGVLPDLTVLGKIVGGGLPAAAYCGRAELMEEVAPAGEVYQAGTLSGNPLAVAAGLATLKLLDRQAYLQLGRYSEQLALGLRAAAADAGVPVQVNYLTGLVTTFFLNREQEEGEVVDFAAASACDLDRYGKFCRALLESGIYAPPSQFEAWFPSLAHGEEELDMTLSAAAASFKALD